MDFARKQLEKYGWTDGKGLGKNENGIAQALKPKLKRSVTGVGHDAASDFTEHWWTTLYNKAASNVEVTEKNGKTKKIKTNTDDFQISNSTWKLTKTKKAVVEEEQYGDYFVKKATLTNGGVKMEKVADSESESEEEKKVVFKMTDEELFAACEGRTAHKGARHGLKALGKLARIEQQEQALLEQKKYEGYSQAKKKKKNVASEAMEAECIEPKPKKNKKKKRKLTDENVASEIDDADGRLKCSEENNVTDPDIGCLSKSKKKKRNKNADVVPSEEPEPSTNLLNSGDKYEFLENGVVRKSKKKNKKAK